MSVPFQARFQALAAQRSPLCVGIDPSREALAQWGLPDDPQGLARFCHILVNTVAPLVASVKPQVAFFERHGPAGMKILKDAASRAREHGALVILDAKRGDISTTAAAYGEAFLGPSSQFGGDAITTSAFLGFDSLRPIFDIARDAAAGVFVVVRSSNPEGSPLQQAVMADGRTVAELLADDVTAENERDDASSIGAVVGATLGGEAGRIAARLPDALMLVPGIGAQGATVADIRRDFAGHYKRVIPSISRGVAGAGPDADRLRERLDHYIEQIRGD